MLLNEQENQHKPIKVRSQPTETNYAEEYLIINQLRRTIRTQKKSQGSRAKTKRYAEKCIQGLQKCATSHERKGSFKSTGSL